MNLTYIFSKILKKFRGSAVKHSFIHVTSKIESGSQVINSTMDKHSFCGYDCEIINCEIGSFTSIANGVVIGGGMHPLSWASMSPVFYKGRDSVKAKFANFEREPAKMTVVGHDVWIGRNALIKQGVSIGTGAVIGMGSVVTKDVLPYSIVGGNPARLIRYRFSDGIIKDLIQSKWWELPESELRSCAIFIKDPVRLLAKMKE